jgi:transcriptional regulator with XRE-family HTH domain
MLTESEIGKRIAEIRLNRGLSQEQLAALLGIQRSTLTQIELGNRNLKALELRKISDILEISIEKILADDFELPEIVNQEAEPENIEDVRISVPTMNIEKFKNILLYVLNKCGGKANFGKTVLNKILYFSDFDFYEIYEEHLTGAMYKKLPYGPVPEDIDSILNQMVELKQLKRFETEFLTFPQTKYIALQGADLKKLHAHEQDIIDKVINRYSDWTATKISEYSHKDMPWLASEDGEVIDYELAFYREEPFSARNYNEMGDVY